MGLTSITLTNEQGDERVTLITRKDGVEIVRLTIAGPPETVGLIAGVTLREAVDEAYKKGWKMA
jgi:hypothetical protein